MAGLQGSRAGLSRVECASVSGLSVFQFCRQQVSRSAVFGALVKSRKFVHVDSQQQVRHVRVKTMS